MKHALSKNLNPWTEEAETIKDLFKSLGLDYNKELEKQKAKDRKKE